LGYYWTFVNVCPSFFGINATPTAKISPELMQQAQQFAGTAQMYIKELWICLLRPSSFVFSFILLRLLLYSSFYAAIGAAVDNQTDSQFLYP
jgi:ABC-2 type transport system permease protein